MDIIERQKINRQIIITGAVLVFVVLLFEYSNIDILVQDLFYNFESKQWILDRHNMLTRFIFYDGIKALLVIFVLVLLVGLIFFRKTAIIRSYRQGLRVVVLSACIAPLTIGGLKSITNVPCPKYISHYDGNYPHVTVLETYPEGFQQTEPMQCYPAGHAGGGFAFMSLYFLLKRRRHRMIAFSSAATVGWTIGLYKMALGDHFLSHTVVSMVLAWLIILLVARQVLTGSTKNGKVTT